MKTMQLFSSASTVVSPAFNIQHTASPHTFHWTDANFAGVSSVEICTKLFIEVKQYLRD